MDGQYANIPVYGKRPEKNSSLRAEYEHNKKIILATQNVCGICGKPVDKSLKYPHPFSALTQALHIPHMDSSDACLVLLV